MFTISLHLSANSLVGGLDMIFKLIKSLFPDRIVIVKHLLHVSYEVVVHSEEQDEAEGLQQVVDHVELHRDHVPLLPLRPRILAQTNDILILLVCKPCK